jgi:hypothetical protein
MDMAPIVRRSFGGIDVERFDRVDQKQHAFDVRPAARLQQDFTTGSHRGKRLIAFARADRAQDVDARDDGAKAIRCPADEGEDSPGGEAEDAAPSVEDLFVDRMAEADPVLDLLLAPNQFDLSEPTRR